MYLPTTEVNRQEIILKESIQKILLDSIWDFNSLEISEESTLSFEKDFPRVDAEYVEDTEDWIEEGEPGPSSSVCPHPVDDGIPFDYKKKVVDFWRSGKKGHLKFDTVQVRYKKVTDRRQLTRWAKQVDEGGTRREKLIRVAKFTLKKLRNAVEAGLIVHDSDIKKWALEAWDEQESGDRSFKASSTWIYNFKKAHRIVSRKITKFVSKKTLEDSDILKKSADDFVATVQPLIAEYGPENIYNSDQSGFQLEIHSGRTLTYEGTKKVECSAQSISSTTHSYTIQPTISCDGRLLSPLLIVLKEAGSRFGPLVEKSLYRPPNVYLLPSSSGKMTTGNDAFNFIFFTEMWINITDCNILQLQTTSERG